MPGTTAVRSDDRTDDADAGAGRAPARRLIARPVLPSGRAVVGGLLLALAAVVTFSTWESAARTPGTSYAVARRAVRPGERLGADDLRLVPLDLASGPAGRAFTQLEAVVGRVALGPIGADELIQESQLSDVASAAPLVEVSFALARDRALDGRLRSGDRVDVFATYDDRTEEVVHGAQVVALGGGEAPTLAPDDQLTVTVALEDVGRRAELVHAVRAGEVTLVRSTQTATVDGTSASGENGSAEPPAGPAGDGSTGTGTGTGIAFGTGGDGDGVRAPDGGGGGPAGSAGQVSRPGEPALPGGRSRG